jgi:hypothetical protein
LRDGQQPDSAFPFDTGQPDLLQRYTVANDPTVGNDFAMPRTLRVCNIMKYMPQVVTDRGHTDAGEAEFPSATGESAIEPVCDAIRAHPAQPDSELLSATTHTARTTYRRAEGMPTVTVTGNTPTGTSANTVQQLNGPRNPTCCKQGRPRCNPAAARQLKVAAANTRLSTASSGNTGAVV